MKYENLTPVLYFIIFLRPLFVRSVEKNMNERRFKKMNNAYYKIKIEEWKLKIIIEALEEKLSGIPDELGFFSTKSNIKQIIEDLKLPF